MNQGVYVSAKKLTVEKAAHAYASYIGHLKNGRMEKYGDYLFDDGAVYHGEFLDGMFHGNGVVVFPKGQNFVGLWNKGKLAHGFFQSEDGLAFDCNDDPLTGWRYLNPIWDRRFSPEITHGLRSVETTMKVANCNEKGKAIYEIPPDCFDTGDGFYDAKSKTVYKYLEHLSDGVEANDSDKWSFLRYVTAEEESWIVAKCRKESEKPIGYRKFKNVLSQDLSKVVAAQAMSKQETFKKKSMKLSEIPLLYKEKTETPLCSLSSKWSC